jgi:DNA-binding beta-propeller fold protein YncE
VPIGVISRFVFGALSSASLLCACASGPPASTPSASASLLRSLTLPQAGAATAQAGFVSFGKWMYLAQLYGEDLAIYERNGLSITFFETLRTGVSAPQGTKATINGWWYVANSGHSNVLVYRSTNHGPTGPVTTLDDYGELPSNVDVIPSRRLVAVSNYSTVGKGAGSVSVYLDRQAEPSRILTYGSDPLQGTGVAIDHHGNCYWSFNDANTKNGSIVEFNGCNGNGTMVVPVIASSAGLTFDQHGDLYYVDQTSGIYKCKGTSNCVLFATGFGLPVNINFDLKQKHLWVADATGYIDAVDSKTGEILYKTPAIGGPTDPPFGIAPAPGG